MRKITTADFHKGMYVDYRGQPHQIVEVKHKTHGRGMAHVQVKLKNIKTGNNLEVTFKSGEEAYELDVNTRDMQLLYRSGEEYYFMDNANFEQITVLEKVLGHASQFLKSNDSYQLLIYEDEVIGLKPPKKVRLKVVETEAGVKGDTVASTTKTAKLETGVVIQVPLFIKIGDTIGINPETKEYVERVSS